MKIVDSHSEYSPQEINDLQIRVHTFKKILDEICNIIENGTFIKTDKTDIDNIISVAPFILREYNDLKNGEYYFIDLLEKYEDWLNVISFCVITNQEKINKNKNLKKHWISNIKICMTLYKPMLDFFKTSKK